MNIENQIICDDANRALRNLPSQSVDLIVTDPPYLVGYRDRSGRTVANDTNAEAVLPTYAEMFRVLKQDSLCISFYGWNRIDLFSAAWREAGFRIVGKIVWVKPYASKSGFTEYRHESAFLLAKGNPPRPDNPPADVQEWVYSGNRNHPTEKAVEILKPLILAYSKIGDIVLDPFAGSGSTAAASLLTSRRYIGIELDQNHCATARRRVDGINKWIDSIAL